MTPERLAEIEARARKATTGPWEADKGSCSLWVNAANRVIVYTPGYPREERREKIADINFIAHARTDIPDLIAEVKRLKKIETLHFGLCEETGEDNHEPH